MLSKHRILKLLDAQRHRQLVHAILENGRGGHLRLGTRTLLDWLLNHTHIPTVANALALQRLAELGYHPTRTTDQLAHELAQQLTERAAVANRLDDHRTHHQSSPPPIEDAFVIRALADWVAMHHVATHHATTHHATTHHASIERIGSLIEQACQRFAQDAEHAPTADLDHSIITLWQLARVPAFRRTADIDALKRAIAAADSASATTQLNRHARATAA